MTSFLRLERGRTGLVVVRTMRRDENGVRGPLPARRNQKGGRRSPFFGGSFDSAYGLAQDDTEGCLPVRRSRTAGEFNVPAESKLSAGTLNENARRGLQARGGRVIPTSGTGTETKARSRQATPTHSSLGSANRHAISRACSRNSKGKRCQRSAAGAMNRKGGVAMY